MQVTHKTVEPDVYLLELNGPLNSACSDEVKHVLLDLHEKGARSIVVNLREVPFIDSNGLAALILGLKTFNSDNREFSLAGLQTQPKLVLELTGFDKVFQILDDVAVAANLSPVMA